MNEDDECKKEEGKDLTSIPPNFIPSVLEDDF